MVRYGCVHRWNYSDTDMVKTLTVMDCYKLWHFRWKILFTVCKIKKKKTNNPDFSVQFQFWIHFWSAVWELLLKMFSWWICLEHARNSNTNFGYCHSHLWFYFFSRKLPSYSFLFLFAIFKSRLVVGSAWRWVGFFVLEASMLI